MILRRYMTQQVTSTTALVLGFLVVLLLGGRMIRYFGIAAEGRLDVGLLFKIIGYNLPYFLELILPLSFFIGLMLVFGRLYVDHEMAVLNGSGISRGKLARMMMPLIISLFVAEAGLSLFAKPWGVRQSDTIWQQQALTSAFDLIRPKQFISSDTYHLYVGSMSDDRTELQDVILIQTSDEKLDADLDDKLDDNIDTEVSEQTDLNQPIIPEADERSLATTIAKPIAQTSINDSKLQVQPSVDTDVIVMAKRAVQVEGSKHSDTSQLDLYQGRRYEVGADSLVYNQVGFERYRISINKPPLDTVTEENVGTQTLPVLWRVATGQQLPKIPNTSLLSPEADDGLAENSAQSEDGQTNANNLTQLNDGQVTEQQVVKHHVLSAQAELGYRLALPWLMIIAPMLAVPLAQVKPRQGRWLRLLPAIIIFTSCAVVIMSLKNPVTKGTLSVWINALVIVLFMLLALYFNWASRIHHRVRFRITQNTANQNYKSQDSVNNDDKPDSGNSANGGQL